ncbi:prepilin peptidase [Helicobacter himalayensis]|uniref:prepilin peptidase n=1 Tax=Helicobacter himalayensis TaxID=1591088 RepID=UPI003D6DBC1F
MYEILSTCLYALLCVCMSFLFLRYYCHRARYLSVFGVFLPFLSAFYFKHIAFIESEIIFTYSTFFASFVLALLFVMAVIDFYYFALPNALLLVFILLCMVGKPISILQESHNLELAIFPLTQGFCIMGGMYLLKFILESVRKKPMLGEADILVLGGEGMTFGVEITLSIIFLASLLAFARFGLSAILYFVSKKQKPLSVKFPFVSYIFTATIFSMICIPLGAFGGGDFNV